MKKPNPMCLLCHGKGFLIIIGSDETEPCTQCMMPDPVDEVDPDYDNDWPSQEDLEGAGW